MAELKKLEEDGETEHPEERRESQVQEVQTLLELATRALVDFPDEVRVQVVAGDRLVIFEVRVAPIDVKRLIGRKGRTADALRELLLGLGGKVRARFLLEIIEPTHRVEEIRLPRPREASAK